MNLEMYTNYYFSAVTIVGILRPASSTLRNPESLQEAISGRTWDECFGGTYYMCVQPSVGSSAPQLNGQKTELSGKE